MNYFSQSTANSCKFLLVSLIACCLWLGGQQCTAVEYLTGIQWPEPTVVTPGSHGSPPSDAIVLLGKNQDLSVWENGGKWKFQDGRMLELLTNMSAIK